MFNQPVSVDDNLTMADVILMLYLDSAIYLLLALYIENIWPGQYGIPKWELHIRKCVVTDDLLSRSVFYPFQLSYWRGHTGTTVLPTVDDEADDSAHNPHAFEQVPTDKELGIQMNHVSKVITKWVSIQGDQLLLFSFGRPTSSFWTAVHLSRPWLISVWISTVANWLHC